MIFSKIKTLDDLILFIKNKVNTHPFYNNIYEEIRNDYALSTRNELPILYITKSKKILYANSFSCEILGYNINQLIGAKIETIILKDRSNQFYTTYLTQLINRKKEVISTIVNITDKYGDQYSNPLIALSIIDENTDETEIIKLLFTTKNDTVKESNSTFGSFDKLILEKYTQNSTTAFWQHDLTNSKYLFFGNFENVLGYKKDDLPTDTDTLYTLIHAQDMNKIVLNSKQGSLLFKAGIEIRIRDKENKYKWYKIKALNVIQDNNNKIVEGFIKNIDDYKKTQLKLYNKERQIINNEEINKKIFQALPIGFITYNSKGDYLESNEEFLTLFNYRSKKEINKKNLFENNNVSQVIKNYNVTSILAYDYDTRIIYPNYLLAPKSENIKYYKYKIVSLNNKDNTDTLSVKEYELMDDISRQSQAAYILIFYDKTSLIKTELNLITENKVLLSENKVLEEKVSKAEDCSKQRINLISNIGDDIRSPLLTLSDFIDLANGAENLDEAKAYLGYLKSNFDSIKNTLDMILEYSKINNNDITLRNDTINIDKLCREILELSKRKLNKIHHKYIESNLCKTKYIDNEKFINQPIIISDKAKLSYILNKIINSVVELKSISAIEIYYNLAEIDDDNNITRYIDQNIEIKDIFESLYDEITWSKSNIVVEFVLKFYYKINRLAINESFIESDVLIDKISSTINPLIDLLNAKLSYNEKENNYIKLRLVIPYIKPEYLDSPWLKTKN